MEEIGYMTTQIVNTEKITAEANNLKKINEDITKEFLSLLKKTKSLESEWKGQAGAAACTLMYAISTMHVERENILNDYYNTLMTKINPDYEETENENNKLSEKYFK